MAEWDSVFLSVWIPCYQPKCYKFSHFETIICGLQNFASALLNSWKNCLVPNQGHDRILLYIFELIIHWHTITWRYVETEWLIASLKNQNALSYLQTVLTRRTNAQYLGTLRAVKFSISCSKTNVSVSFTIFLYFLWSFSLSLSLPLSLYLYLSRSHSVFINAWRDYTVFCAFSSWYLFRIKMLLLCILNSHFASILIVLFSTEAPNCGKESESHD